MVNGLNPGLENFSQAGTVVASAGSVATITFDRAFTSAPTVTLSVVGGLASVVTATTTGATANVVTASASGTWIAYGN